MKIDKNLYEIFKSLYGTTFNRILTVGTYNTGYENFQISTIEELCDLFTEYNPKKEFYISLYDYDTPEKIIKWSKLDSAKFEETAVKNCIIFRFRENTDIIKEETEGLSLIQKFMFIRRFINLGSNKTIVKEAKETYETIKNLFNIKSTVIYNGYNECLLYVFIDEIELENPTVTYYYFYKFIENEANLTRLSYSQIEPFSQIVPLIGSQNSHSRLYIKPYDINFNYLDIIKNSENRTIDKYDFKQDQDTHSLENLLKTVDQEITKRLKEGNTNSWDYDLDKLFNENRN